MPTTQTDLGDEGLENGDQIDDYLAEYFDDGAEVHIPPGNYAWDGDGLGGDYSDAALIGDGEPGAVQLQYPEGEYRYHAIRAQGGEVRLENITLRGATAGEEAKLRAEARAPDATMVLDTVWLPDGVVDGHDAVGLYVGADHAGTIKFVDCYVEGFSDNGLYASGPGAGYDDAENGQVIVEGGLYKNNNISNVRLGSDNSIDRGVTMVHDGDSPPNDGVWNQRNLRIRQPGENILVENCDIYHAMSGYWPVELSTYLEGEGSGVLRDTRIYTESSKPAIGHHDGDWHAENVHITGPGDHTVGIDATGTVTGADATEASPLPRTPIHAYDARDGASAPSDGPSEPSGGGGGGAPTTPGGGFGQDFGYHFGGGPLPDDAEARLLAFVSAAGAGECRYTFTTTGDVTARTEAPYDSPAGNPVRATSNFEIQSLANGHTYVTGSSGNGYGDAFAVTGRIVDIAIDSDDMWAELDGDELALMPIMAATAPAGGGTGDGDESDGDHDVSLTEAFERLRELVRERRGAE